MVNKEVVLFSSTNDELNTLRAAPKFTAIRMIGQTSGEYTQ